CEISLLRAWEFPAAARVFAVGRTSGRPPGAWQRVGKRPYAVRGNEQFFAHFSPLKSPVADGVVDRGTPNAQRALGCVASEEPFLGEHGLRSPAFRRGLGAGGNCRERPTDTNFAGGSTYRSLPTRIGQRSWSAWECRRWPCRSQAICRLATSR